MFISGGRNFGPLTFLRGPKSSPPLRDQDTTTGATGGFAYCSSFKSYKYYKSDIFNLAIDTSEWKVLVEGLCRRLEYIHA